MLFGYQYQTVILRFATNHFMDQFQIIRELGSGSFGRVLQVLRKQDGKVMAMKTVKMKQLKAKEKDNALNQVRLLASIDSPNVIKYKGAFFQECGNILSIIMEFADGGDLAGFVKNKINKRESFDENFIWKVAYDLLNGLKFLHQNNIIHRDVKTANVFFVEGVAKLGDLNVSKVTEGKFAQTQIGTPYYTSPEIWEGKKYTANCDVWSLGCLLYELCCLRTPFLARDLPGLIKRVISGYYEPVPPRYSRNLSSLIRKCLTRDNMKRPSVATLLQDDVFQNMGEAQEGEIDLLDTIRCPRVLKLINRKLPEDQYGQKKLKTLKFIAQDSSQSVKSPKALKSMKSLGKEKKNIWSSSIEKSQNRYEYKIQPPYHRDIDENKSHQQQTPMKAVMQSPQGYVKLPKIRSYKAL